MVTGVLVRARGAVLPHAQIPAADTPRSGVLVRVAHGRIEEVNAIGSHEAGIAGTLLPGFVDLQVNGAGGHDVAEADGAALDGVAAAVWRGGAVAFLPTLITAPFDQILHQLGRVAAWIEGWGGAGAEPLGIHLEGPFLEVSGTHCADHFLDPTPARIRAILAAARGRLALVTLAPGRQNAPAAVRMLKEAGVAVALGHGGSAAQFDACLAAGATLATHLFNAMGRLHHREPGLAGRALDAAALSCSLICDGVHVDPVMVRNAFAVLGADRTVLVTDAVAAAGGGDGTFRLGGVEVRSEGGVVRNAAGQLAGSALTMAMAATRFLAMLGGRAGPWTLARVAAANPARLLGRADYGAIAPGSKAAFTVFDAGGFSALRV